MARSQKSPKTSWRQNCTPTTGAATTSMKKTFLLPITVVFIIAILIGVLNFTGPIGLTIALATLGSIGVARVWRWYKSRPKK